MSNKPNFRAPLVLSEYLDRRRDEGSITVQIPDAEPLVIPPADLWPAEAFNLPRRNRSGEATWRAVLGDDEYNRFAEVLPRLGVTTPAYVVIDNLYKEGVEALQGVSAGE